MNPKDLNLLSGFKSEKLLDPVFLKMIPTYNSSFDKWVGTIPAHYFKSN